VSSENVKSLGLWHAQGRVTLEEICEFVASTGMSKVELRPDDVLQVRDRNYPPHGCVGLCGLDLDRRTGVLGCDALEHDASRA
jgi:hypothetical protein